MIFYCKISDVKGRWNGWMDEWHAKFFYAILVQLCASQDFTFFKFYFWTRIKISGSSRPLLSFFKSFLGGLTYFWNQMNEKFSKFVFKNFAFYICNSKFFSVYFCSLIVSLYGTNDPE